MMNDLDGDVESPSDPLARLIAAVDQQPMPASGVDVARILRRGRRRAFTTRQMPRYLGAAACVAGVFALAVAVDDITASERGGVPAEASPTPLSTSNALAPATPSVRRQEAVHRAGVQFLRQVRDVPGYMSLRIDPAALRVVVSWKSPVPEKVRRLSGLSPTGVTIMVEGVRFSQQDVEEAGARLWAASKRDQIPQFTSVQATNNFSVMTVGLAPVDWADDQRALAAKMSKIAGTPVQLRKQDPGTDLGTGAESVTEQVGP